MNPLIRISIATRAFKMLTMMIPVDCVNHTPISESAGFPIVAPSPRKSGAKPRYDSSQPERATHCRIQIT